VGELATRTGRTTRTIRFYEELGLLEPRTRSEGGYRLYGEDALLQVEWIDKLQALKFTLKEIAVFVRSLQGHGSGPEMMAELNQVYSQKLAETRIQIQRLNALVSEVNMALDYLKTCSVCTSTSAPLHCRNCETHDESSPSLVAAIVNTI